MGVGRLGRPWLGGQATPALCRPRAWGVRSPLEVGLCSQPGSARGEACRVPLTCQPWSVALEGLGTTQSPLRSGEEAETQ